MQVYSRDSSVMTPYGAIITAMANWWRRGENYAAIRTYEKLGIPIYDMVTAGTFEGGDFNVIEEGVRADRLRRRPHAGRRRPPGRRPGSTRKAGKRRIAFIDEYYVHIDLMVVPIAEKLTAVCLACTEPGIVDWLKGKGHEIIDVPFQDTMALGCNFMSLGKDRVIAPNVEPDADRPAQGARLRGRRGRYERDLQDRRRHPLHGAGAEARAGVGAPALGDSAGLCGGGSLKPERVQKPVGVEMEVAEYDIALRVDEDEPRRTAGPVVLHHGRIKTALAQRIMTERQS